MSGLNLFVNLRNGIKEQLFEDSENAIQNIIQSLARNDSIYRAFNEGLRLAKSIARRSRIPNSLVEYIHRAHIAYVVITLRRLYDDKKEGTRAVNSLRTITEKILHNQHLFIRDNYVTHDGTPYEEHGNLDWRTKDIVQGRHLQFDLLCNLPPGKKRNPKDKVNPKIAIMLHQKTVLRKEIENFANKFIAHSSAKNNRPDEEYSFKNLTLSRLQIQYRNVIWSSQQIGKLLCEPILTGVPTPQFDVLEQWDNGLFDSYIKSKLHKYWDGRIAWWQKWTDYYRDSYKVFLSPGHKGLFIK